MARSNGICRRAHNERSVPSCDDATMRRERRRRPTDRPTNRLTGCESKSSLRTTASAYESSSMRSGKPLSATVGICWSQEAAAGQARRAAQSGGAKGRVHRSWRATTSRRAWDCESGECWTSRAATCASSRAPATAAVWRCAWRSESACRPAPTARPSRRWRRCFALSKLLRDTLGTRRDDSCREVGQRANTHTQARRAPNTQPRCNS